MRITVERYRHRHRRTRISTRRCRPFGQIDSRMSRKYQGTGLGLPLTKSMIELHGGRLTLESEIGRGTKAIIWLPRARIIQLAQPRPDPCRPSSRGETARCAERDSGVN